MALEGALVGYAVTELLNKVLEEVSLVVERNKNCEALRSLLQRMQPLVSRIETDESVTSGAAAWLQSLQNQLQKTVDVLQECKTQGRLNVIKSIPTSKRVINVTKGVRDLLQEAGVVVLNCTLLNSQKRDEDATEVKKLLQDNREYFEEISTILGELQTDVKRMELSKVTRDAVNTPTNIYGRFVNTITVPGAFSVIKSQADTTTASTTHNDAISSNSSDHNEELAASTATLQRYPLNEMVFGGDDVVEELKKLVLSDERIDKKWVGVWSMGGAGKTLTAERLFNDSMVQQHFVGGSFWLTVGRDRTALSLLRMLLKDVTGHFEHLSEEFIAKNRVRSELEKRGKVLLVLDDVWISEILDSLDVLRPSSGSVTFVTTRNKEILDRKSAEKLQIPMLSETHSWQLFCWHAFHGVDKVLPFLEDVAKQVADECKGLPLALKVIGGSLAGQSNRAQWQHFLTRLKNAEVVSREHEQQLYSRLQLSVDDLSSIDKHLQDCFYYFAAFPEDASVSVIKDLLGLWVGEGIVGSNSAFSPEDEAYLLLGWLIARSLIELQSTHLSGSGLSKVYMTCKIHDVLRDLARYNLQRDPEPYKRVCLYQPGWQLKRFPQDWNTTSGPPLNAQRLSVMFNDLEELPSQMTAPYLRVLLIGNNVPLQSLPKQFLGGLLQLRVLDLRETGIREIPDAALGNLRELVLLNLSSCSNLEKVPDSIKHLKNLKELQVSNCPKLKVLPGGLRFLTKLQTLNLDCSPVWSHEQRVLMGLRLTRAATLPDLSLLTALTNLNVSSTSQSSFPVNLNSLNLLKQLHVRFAELQSFPDISKLNGLETLDLFSRKMTILPSGTSGLSNLKMLDLKNCTALSCLPALDELPFLEYLDLSGCQNLTHLPKSFGRPGAFPSLLQLDMYACDAIDVDNFPDLQPGAMPHITLLNLSGWVQLRTLPASLQILTSLHTLDLSICYQLESLESAFDPRSFTKLEDLFLESTQKLTRLPASLALLPKLVNLDLRNCPARHQLPEELQNLEKLQIRT